MPCNIKTIYLKDYTPSAFLIPTVELDVALFEEHTRVTSRLTMRRNPAAADRSAPLVLDGEELALESVALNGRPLVEAEYALTAEHLTIPDVPDEFVLETVCRIRPQDNTKLSGFYASKDGCFTQCEAEGFRRITYFIDRPDVMARFTTTLHADKARYPVLLANGNLVAAAATSRPRKQARRRATGPNGRTPSPSLPISSPWSPRSSTCWKTASSRARERTPGSRSMSSPASSIRRASPCRRSRRR